MEHDVLKLQIAGNIAALRKSAGLTQAELAQKINYSDKAVSKWERGESAPDIMTMVQLAQVLGVSVDSLVYDPEEYARLHPAVAPAKKEKKKKEKKKKPPRTELSRNRKIIAALVSILVWSVALLIWHTTSSVGIKNMWLCFVAAVPATAIVMLSLLSAWRYYRFNRLHISVILWGILTLVFLALWVQWGIFKPSVFSYTIPGQLTILLWFQMHRKEASQ